MMKIKKIVNGICIIVLLISLFGFNAIAQDKVLSEEKLIFPKQLRIGSLGVGSLVHTMLSGLAPYLERDTGSRVRVIPDWIETRAGQSLCEYRDFELYGQGVSIMTSYMMGVDANAAMKVHQVRLVWQLSVTPFSQMVTLDSKLESIYDLKNSKRKIRVGTIPSGPFTVRVTYDALPAFLDMTKEDIEKHWEIIPISNYSEEVRAVSDGRVDVGINICPLSTVTREVDAAPQGTKWLDMPLDDKKGWSRFLDIEPTVIPGVITTGIKSAHGTHGYMTSYAIFASDELDKELVYELAKYFAENHDSYKDIHPATDAMTVEAFREFLDVSPVPIHEGTVKYLKEIGVWSNEDDKWNEEAIALNTKYVEASERTFAEAKEKSITIELDNEDWLNLWNKHKAGLEGFKSRLK